MKSKLAELERICLEALTLPPAERSAYLALACKDDSVRREVESLLSAEGDSRNFFPTQAPQDLGGGPEDYGTAGAYEIQEKLGEGGMGIVFRARQSAPVVRDVALKVVRPGMASRQLVARFLMERQALAIMDHPNIARVLDAGETSRGLPYFVMELVAGRTIAAFCQEEGLPLRGRIGLMIQVCQAIQHAHQKGIIHRDIKPSNVLVTAYDGKAVPKVIDFGIAKAIAGLPAEMPGATRAGAIMGTFEFMSPEQAEGGATDVDTRADVYSLGALLYLLVCGKAPLPGLSLEDLTYTEILRRIRGQTPQPVSRLTGNPELRELDWILARALEKDRARRYQTAEALGADLRRFLDGEPVEAGPLSAAYRLRKMAARHKYWIGAAAVLMALLLSASIAMAFALRQQSRANSAAVALRQVVRRIIIERPAQLAEIPNRTALRGQLMRDAEGALNALSQDAGGDPALQMELARANLEIGLAKGPYSAAGSEGDPAGAAGYVKRAVELYTALARQKPGDPEVRRGQIEALSTWLHLQYRLGREKEGVKAARQLENEIGGMTSKMRDLVQANWYLSIGYMELGTILFTQGLETEGLALHRKALETFRGGIPAQWMKDPEKLDHLSHLERELVISTWMQEGISEQVELTAQRSVEAVAGCPAASCRMRHAQAEGTLGEIEWASGRREEGVATLRKSLSEFEVLAAEDPANAVFTNAGTQVRAYLALALAAGPPNESSEAVSLAQKNLHLTAGAEASLDKGRVRILVNRITLGAALLGDRRFADAVRELRETLESNRDWKPNPDLWWSALHLLARAFAAQGRFEDAISTAKEATKFASVEDTGGGFSTRVMRALAARDYASAVAGWTGSSPEQRRDALRLIEMHGSRSDRPGGVLVGPLIDWFPAAEEVAPIRDRLRQAR
jgi:tetratricopeptide (TPR) repeat protein